MTNTFELDTSERATSLFSIELATQRMRLERMFLALFAVQWLAAIVVALVYSPIGWADKANAPGGYLTLAIVGGALLTLVPAIIVRLQPGTSLSRHAIAIIQIFWSSMFIHLSGGRIETHFHIFGSLAWLAFFLDWKVLVTATVMVALDHLLRGLIVPESVYGIMHAGHWRFVEHALWVAFEDVILVIACRNGLRSIAEVAGRQAKLEEMSENQTIAIEMAIAEMQAATSAA
jgi:two-component system, NtrC family, sensor histidine kinase HydH